MPRILWSPEQARTMAARGNAAKAALRAALREAHTLAQQLATSSNYTDRIKARVRAQVELTLSRIEEENSRGTKVDGAKLDRLASALERLAELERILDDRPAPGTKRPSRDDTPASKQPPTPPAPMPVSAPPITRTIPNATPPTAEPAAPTPPTPLLSDPPEW